MLFSEAMRMPVVATGTATTVGHVDDIVVDPPNHTVVALRLNGKGGGGVLHWPDVAGFGADAVTVASMDAVRDPDGPIAALLERDYRIVGKRLLAASGEERGRVLDVDFDPDSGSVTGLFTTAGRIHGDNLVGCGTYAVVARMDQPG